jgi:carboxyl-terminal processing protease
VGGSILTACVHRKRDVTHGCQVEDGGSAHDGSIGRRADHHQFTAEARNSYGPLPLEEMQQLAAVFGMIKTDYVEPVDERS